MADSEPSWQKMMVLKWVIVVPLALAAICPFRDHQVCNVFNDEDHSDDSNKHQCTCAITAISKVNESLKDRPAPEQSCTNLIKRDEDGTFPLVTLTFNLKDSPEMNEFPEDSFRDTIAGALRVNAADIIILRVNCLGTEDTLTVQFGVLKKEKEKSKKTKNDDKDDDDSDEDKDEGGDDDDDDDNDDDDDDDDDDSESPKYAPDMFVDAESVATRMKAMGHLSQIADLQVDSIEHTDELIALEFAPDNTTLIIQAIAVGVSVILMTLLGVWATCRRHDYSDDLQKA
ncbi:unnamed protein product [Nippostrongylus brasiliensis]|uniref:ZP domain-containing protein n=1 Tax=Nippostrongylus brasiliensis TaxID=27835 RepID=A0A0N4Y2S9_NIPBR|nr:unnamed protein product [Nippostrongylus brasiliensis]